MDAQELYDEIKRALDYFGLKFGQMAAMKVELAEDQITFTHGERQIVVTVADEADEGI